ncbi:unnamed protein product [Acanthocheilonema viteae]|uniref:Uncharacterized protein n=1 Tax=Acanthocheilonema viteae TaxID=6277 RepID=A0A498S4Z3_ACAVI|nr:unnamed protein product [Acanthocheilonema viteae]
MACIGDENLKNTEIWEWQGRVWDSETIFGHGMELSGHQIFFAHEKLHIKALNLKINSLEAEKVILITRNDELESRLIQLGKNVSDASVIASSSHPAAIEDISNLVSLGSAFKPIHTQMMMQMGRTNERQKATGALQWSMEENVTTPYGHQYDEELINNMRTELNAARQECSLVQEKIVQMGCVNFELERELKDAKEKLGKAEMRAQQAEEEARRNCAQQAKHQESLQSKFLAKFNALEKEVNDLKEELVSKNEQLKARTMENNKRNEEIKQWRFAMDEMEAVHMEIQMLEKQLNNEKAAMESKWAEVRTILLERKGDMSRKTSSAEPAAGGEQSTVIQLKQMTNTINDLKNTVDKQTKQLEREKAEKRKFKAIIRQLEVNKEVLVLPSLMKNSDREQHLVPLGAQIIGLQKQRDFMDREITLLCTLNKSKDVLIQTLKAELEGFEKPGFSRPENDRNEDKNSRTEQLQAQIEIMSQEKSEVLNLLAKSNAEFERLQMHAQRLQMEHDRLQSQLQFSPERNLNVITSNASTQLEFVNVEVGDLSMAEKMTDSAANKSVNIKMKEQMERLAEAMQQKNTELRKVLNENEALKIKCVESTAALDLLSDELERRSQEKDAIIEMLQSQHTYLTQTILLNEKGEKQLATPSTVSQSINTNIEPKCVVRNASTVMDGAENGPIPVMRHCATQTRTDFNFSEITEMRQKLTSGSFGEVIHNDDSTPEVENQEICQYVDKPSQIHDNLTDDARQLMILNAELETAVEVLKGEIWTLNEQLKGSLVDREDLSEKLCELSQRHEEEIERARERERDLEEQKDMAERSQRQAALAENESNCRLVEWQEKSAQMENSRIELENAYAKLSEYYQQLQQAYNALYMRFNTCKVDSNTQTIVDSNTFKISEKFAEKIEHLKNKLTQQKTELKRQAIELQHVRDLLREHLHVALKNVRDLREMNLKLLKDIVVDNVQAARVQLCEILNEVHSCAEKVIVRCFEEKERKDAEIALAMKQLINVILTENISQAEDLSLSVIVDAVSKKFLERESEHTVLKNDLLNERNDEAALKMTIQRSVSEKEEESELKIKGLEDLLQVTQFSLSEYVIRCQQLQAKLDLISTDQSSEAAAKCGTSGSESWNCSTPCTICRELRQTKQPAPTPQLQLAILAARLTTKIADNDALFRCNAELAQTNLRLQNEVSELREQMTKHITSTNDPGTSSTNQQSLFQQQHISKHSSNQTLEQKAMHSEEKKWKWDAEDSDAKLVSSSKVEDTIVYQNQQITGFMIKDEIKTPALRELESQEQSEESLEKKLRAENLNASERFEEKNEKMENNTERLGKCSGVLGEHLKREIKAEQLEDGLERKQHEGAKHQQELEEMFKEKKLKVSRTNREELLSLKSENMQLTDFMGNSNQEREGLKEELQSTKTPYENEGIYCELFQAVFIEELEKQKEAVKTKLESENGWISNGAPKQFQALPEERTQDIPRDSIIAEDRMQLLQELEGQLQQKEIEMQELEKENRSLSQQLEKGRLRDEVENEVTSRLREEITLLKQENESLNIELAKKQASLDEEKASMKAELVNLECQLENREIILEELKTKLKHTQEESIQVQRQLYDNGTQTSELQIMNEVSQEFHQQLIEAQRKIMELEQRLDQVIEQNGLLKNAEEKLMDALMVSNKQLAKMESKNEKLESEVSNLQASLLKAEKMAKKTNQKKSVMHGNSNAVIEVHGKSGTSSAKMQPLDSPVERCFSMQEKNEDKLRRRKGSSGGFQGAEKI